MNKLLLLLTFGIVAFNAISQEHTTGVYTSVYSDQYLDIQIAEGVFTDNSTNKSHLRYFLKYVNKTASDLQFSFVRSTNYQGSCDNCPVNLSESQFSVELQPNEVKSFSTDNTDKRFYIFVKDNNGLIKNQLINFEITTITYINQ